MIMFSNLTRRTTGMVFEFRDNSGLPRRVVLSQLVLLIGGFFYLRIGGIVVATIFVFTLAYAFLLFIKLTAYSARVSLISLCLVLIALSPILTYGNHSNGITYFGSAYSVDYQQYLSVAFSLARQGLPFSNPYWPDQPGYYHYGFLIPYAGAIRLAGLVESGFFIYSYTFFIYSALSIFILFILVRVMFFSNTRDWLVAVSVGVFATSYKSLFGLISLIAEGSESSGYDTPIGFKTFQNDMIFGPHYLYSGIFILYVLHVLSCKIDQKIEYRDVSLIALISFIAPLLNGFSFVILASLIGGFCLVKNCKAPLKIFSDKYTWILLIVLALAYLGMKLLNVYTPGLRMAKLDLQPLVTVNVIFGLFVNYLVLIFFFLGSDKKSSYLYKVSAVAICILIMFITFLSIEGDLEGRFSISRRLGTFILLLLVINIKIDRISKWKLLLLVPAFLTFLGQNYYFFNSQEYRSRTVGVSNELFGVNRVYRLDDIAYQMSNRYRFNFDMITHSASVDYPNSLGFRQYSPLNVERSFIGNVEKDILDITFRDNTFVPASSIAND